MLTAVSLCNPLFPQRHFSVFAVNFPSSDALERIYGQILGVHFQQNSFSPADLAQVVQAALWLHHKMVQNFLPTAVKFHYTFNLRDLSSTFQVFTYRVSYRFCSVTLILCSMSTFYY